MEININTMTTAYTPALGLPMSGHHCAAVRAFGADVAAANAGVAVITGRKRDFWGSDTWRPLTS